MEVRRKEYRKGARLRAALARAWRRETLQSQVKKGKEKDLKNVVKRNSLIFLFNCFSSCRIKFLFLCHQPFLILQRIGTFSLMDGGDFIVNIYGLTVRLQTSGEVSLDM